MGLDKDFIPSWWWPAVTAAVVVGFLVGCLMFLALLSNVRHVNLLEALLPRHVIRSLHRGRVVAESLPEVYTLFVGAPLAPSDAWGRGHLAAGAQRWNHAAKCFAPAPSS